ncbi:MAG: RyR domain-containing protein [Candidatus Hydrogenedentes bacterium]|nr:RyR domain-containing protein [Candidatus Hydrogenedentota bacterium]
METKLQAWHRAQVEAYREELPRYQAYAAALRAILERAAVKIAPLAMVQVRPKSISSFAEKALRKRAKYHDPVHQLTDLCGARVITVLPHEVDSFCSFIRDQFAVDEDNTLDAGTRLGRTEFGYRSFHFVVRVKAPGILGVAIPAEIGQRKAEIQVRTVLQHAYAAVGHDRFYKNVIRIPDSLHRDAARLAALLEESEGLAARLGLDVDAYNVSYGAYMSKDEMDAEIAALETIHQNEVDPNNRPLLALRMAKILKVRGQWDRIIEILAPYHAAEVPSVLREYGYALCQQHKANPASPEYRSGQEYLEKAAGADSNDAETAALLAETWQEVRYEDEKARKWYRKAFEANPGNPYHLASFLEYELSCERSSSVLPALAPSIQAGIQTCRAHADAGIELPWAFFTMAKLHVLLGDRYPSLTACCKGVAVSVAEDSGVAEGVIDKQIDSVRRLKLIEKCLPGSDWARESMLEGMYRLLLLAKSVGFHGGRAVDQLTALKKASYDPKNDVLIIAGGCDELSDEQIPRYRGLLFEALDSFKGTVVCGGTTSGISGLVGSIARDLEGKGRKGFEAVAYHPRRLPAHVALDERNYTLHQSDGEDFGPLESLQTFIDLITSGIAPTDVKMLGFNGGAISAFEYRLGVALGARVGVVKESGRAAREFLNDKDWRAQPGVLALPEDTMTIRAFAVSAKSHLTPANLELAARAVQEKYREDNKHEKIDPSMLPWEELAEHLKESCRQQAAYAEEILRKTGYGVRKAAGGGPLVKFTPEEIEVMAELEHGRWNAERIADGWTPGPRDPLNKVSPYLVPWNELTEQVKQWDRDAVGYFPAMFKRFGLEVHKP